MSTPTPIPFRLGTFSAAGGPSFPGILIDERVISLRAASSYIQPVAGPIPGAESMLAMLQHWESNWPRLLQVAQALRSGQAPALANQMTAVGSLTLHPPVDLPRQIFCSGANYKKHVVQIIIAQAMEETKGMSAEERRAHGHKLMDHRAQHGTPFFFVKAQSAVVGPFDPVVLPADVQQPDWELELAVIIGRTARRVSRERALDHVAGYSIANDVTSRERVNRKPGDMREMGMDWVASKCSPSYLPLGPYLVPAAFVGDPQDLQITLKLNGDVMQDESTSDMIFGVARLIEHLSNIVVLQPGDVICTGSPAGNGVHYGRYLRPGDVLEGDISGFGAQRNPCVAEPV